VQSISGHMISQKKEYQLTKLLPAVEPEIPNDDDELASKCNPEGGRSHWASFQSILEIPRPRIWEDT
jgi:hypothetical protein